MQVLLSEVATWFPFREPSICLFLICVIDVSLCRPTFSQPAARNVSSPSPTRAFKAASALGDEHDDL